MSLLAGLTLAVVVLPTGARLDPAGTSVDVGNMPLAIALAPGGERAVLLLSGWREEGLEVVDLRAGRVVQHLPQAGAFLGLAFSKDSRTLFASGGGEDVIHRYAWSGGGARLEGKQDPPPAGPHQGSTPNALALSADGTRLFVAEADNNAVAVFDAGSGRLLGRIPVGWYPAALAATAEGLLVVDAKGRGTRANPGMVQADTPLPPASVDYALGQLDGTVTVIDGAALRALGPLTARVAAANGWDGSRAPARYPPFRHVVYVIKENRTYDQVFGDVAEGDGDPSLLFFPREVTPNHHALAERFGLFDRFFTNAEVSSQGHIWSTAAYVTDYTEKLVPSMYASRRPEREEGDVDEPAGGFLWTAALRKGLTFRIYGEFGQPAPGSPQTYTSSKPALAPYTSPTYPSYDLSVPDQRRADAWIAELEGFSRRGAMPALQILHLPNDHTAGAVRASARRAR